ncbi:MAG: hypothetical protein V1838_05300 [Patescibacteria group bacterium]
MNKFLRILLNAIPVIIMVALIPLISNDYWLTGIYVLIIIISLVIKYESRDYIFLIFGFFIMLVLEYIFISTGVETFERNSLFGLMPLWLPFLWAYALVAMKRAVNVLQ